jgi:uncharacterized protein YqgC (DUF456 family)
MVLDIILVVLGFCLLIAGLLGCIIPALPGPPLSYTALLLIQITGFADFSLPFLLITAGVTAIITIVDYLIPIWGTRKWGGSRAGALGAMAGLLAGIFFVPLGIIIGPFVGAFAGELMAGHNTNAAFRSGFGSFIGFLFGTVLKVAVCLAFTYYFIKELV